MCAAVTGPALEARLWMVSLQQSVSRPCAARNVKVPLPVSAADTGARVASNRRPPRVGVIANPRQKARAATRVCGTPATMSP